MGTPLGTMALCALLLALALQTILAWTIRFDRVRCNFGWSHGCCCRLPARSRPSCLALRVVAFLFLKRGLSHRGDEFGRPRAKRHWATSRHYWWTCPGVLPEEP